MGTGLDRYLAMLLLALERRPEGVLHTDCTTSSAVALQIPQHIADILLHPVAGAHKMKNMLIYVVMTGSA